MTNAERNAMISELAAKYVLAVLDGSATQKAIRGEGTMLCGSPAAWRRAVRAVP